jgi:hypothetical protein
MPELTIQCSQLSLPTTKGKGWSGEDLSYWLSTFVSVCQFPKQQIRKGRVQRREGKGVRADLMSLNRHFIEHGIGQPHA